MSNNSMFTVAEMIGALALQEPPHAHVLRGERPAKQKQPLQRKYRANKRNKKLKRKKVQS